jgi:hypothetical protein
MNITFKLQNAVHVLGYSVYHGVMEYIEVLCPEVFSLSCKGGERTLLNQVQPYTTEMKCQQTSSMIAALFILVTMHCINT